MYTFIFEIYGRYEFVDERTAHTYLRHPSGAQRAQLKYIGAIKTGDRQARVKAIGEETKKKYPNVGQGEDHDSAILEMRAYADEKYKELEQEYVALADKAIMPENWDVMAGNINNGDSFRNVKGGLKNVIGSLR